MKPRAPNVQPRLHLMLLRHAKSDWSDASRDDRDRPLNARGRKAAVAMGKAMANLGFRPVAILCSPARRAHETWDAVSAELAEPPPVKFVEDLYDFGDGSRLLEVARRQGGAAASLMLAGHNPALENLARRLIGSGPRALRQEIERKYPTGALAVIALPAAAWPDIAEGTGELLNFIRPRDLAGTEGE